MEKKDTCAYLLNKLEEMQVSRRLDPSSLEIMQIAIKETEQKESFWLSNKEISPQTAFVLYHASRNMRMVLEKMHERFDHATKMHENPKVVDDAMTVFPELSEICGFVDFLQEAEIKPDTLEYVRRRIRALRNTAQKVGMLPTIEEEVKAVNKVELAKEFGDLAKNLRLNLV